MPIGRWFFIVAVVAASTFLVPSQARADVQYFRYSVSTYAPGPPKYTGRLPSAKAKGAIYEVEHDARGRVARVAIFRDGKKLTETVYQYAGNAKFSRGYKFYRGGELDEIGTYQRNAEGHITRAEYRTAQGALSSYETSTYQPNEIDTIYYSATGTTTGRDVDYYQNGLLIRTKSYSPGDNVYYDTKYDIASGQSISQEKWENGKQQSEEKYTHDENGDLVRIDLFDPATNKPYGRKEYAGGLRRRDMYNFTDGTTKEIDYAYDSKRILTNAKMKHNGTLVCTFTFDRLPDGTVKRTLATGPNGELWAEYPDAVVTNVYQDGSSVDNKPGTIYKTGNWY